MKYKNITTLTQVIPNIGSVDPGAFIETEKEINNSNFELVVESKQQVVPVVEPEPKKSD